MKFDSTTVLQGHSSLAEQFERWVRGGKKDNNYFFGKNVSTSVSIPHPNYDSFMHVHVVPGDDPADIEDYNQWKADLTSRSESVRRNRSSDHILYYAVKGDVYLLLAVASHQLMRPPKDKLNALANLADEYFAK